MQHRISRTTLLFLPLLFYVLPAIAQENSVKGIVTDTAENRKLHYAIVALINLSDTTLYHSVRSLEDGSFELTQVPPGKYTLLISYPKMADFLQGITVSDTSKINLGKINMITQADLLQEVVVKAGIPIRMRGDTLEYTADSFAVRPGANVEELLKRLPGIQLEKNGKIYAQGQEVKKLLVDGDEFFSDDPGLATHYLHADAIDKVQVFDQKSELAQFSGIDDGSRTKTINLKLKSNKKNGYFGKLSAGSDGKDYYRHEAMGALFDGARKMSIFGLSYRAADQGLFSPEISRYVGQDYEVINDGTGMTIFSGGNDDGDGMSYSASGIPSVMSGGAHYSDKWKNNRQKLFSNYRVNQVNSSGWSNANGFSMLPDGTGFYNTSQNTSDSYSFSQKASGSFTTPLDSFIVVKLSVNGNAGNDNNHYNAGSESKNEKGFLVNNNAQANSGSGSNNKFGSNLSYQQKFRKTGRTLSFLIQQESRNMDLGNYNHSNTNYYDPASGIYTRSDSLNQLQQTHNTFESYAAKATYTDMPGKDFHISAEYGWKTAISGNVFNTFNNKNGKYEDRVDSLSNDYRFTANTHITGVVLGWNRKKVGFSVGSKLYFTSFRQVNNDLKQETDRNFINLAPQFNLTLQLKQTMFFNVYYSGQTVQPSVEELQPLRKSNSSLYVQIGNPGLKPSFNQNGTLSYFKFSPLKGSSLSVSASVGYTANAITSNTQTDSLNRTISQYINLNGIAGLNGSINYSWMYKKVHLRPGVSASFGRYGNYSIENGRKLKNESLSMSSNFSLNYDRANKLSLNYRGGLNYNIGKSDISTNKTNSIFTHSHTLGVSVYFPKKFELGSDCSFSFQPKNSSFNTSFNSTRWNAFLEKKLLKNDQGAIRFSVSDILNNNSGYSRSVYGNSISESDRLVIKRYWLLTLTWNFSKN